VIYTPPALTAVDFALSAHTPADTTPATQALASYTPPALAAVNFALISFSPPTYMNVGWELLPDESFPTQYAGLRYFNGSVKQLALVALADAPSGMGAVWRIRKNGTDYAVYLVETSDPNASEIRLRTSAGTKAARLMT
jgi:hypothetical protein